ncbi:MAG: hypothetical protein GXP38_03745 [Chloroflexi bacterium]|nr:hypothetical protein [Chloroflexota bacterium]
MTPSDPIQHVFSQLIQRILVHRWRAALAVGLLILALIAGGVAIKHSRSTIILPATREEALQAAIREFQKAIELDPSAKAAYDGLSEAYELRGVFAAADVWEQAAQTNPGEAWPFIEQAGLYQRHELDSLAQSAYRKTIVADPIAGMNAVSAYLRGEEKASNAEALGPFAVPGQTYEINQELKNGWIFLGYHGDEAKLVRGDPTTLLLFWQGVPGQRPGEQKGGWYELDANRWMYVLQDARSLLVNGDFEAEATTGEIPGFSHDIYNAEPGVRRTEMAERGGKRTRVGVLANDESNQNSSFVSEYYPVPADTLYLQTGWVQSEGGNAYLGRQWRGKFAKGVRNYSYVANRVRPEKWQHYAGIAEPLPGSESVSAWLLNFNGDRPVRFDDVTFIPIPSPLTTSARRQLLFESYLADKTVIRDDDWRDGMATAGPAVSLNHELDNGWTFLGYTIDESALAAGRSTPSFLYWLGVPGVVPGFPKDGWVEVGDNALWIQIIEYATNLLSNGDFEGGIKEGKLAGYPRDIYHADPTVRQIRLSKRAGQETHIGVLDNNERNLNSSFVSRSFDVKQNTIYLEGGWIRAPQGGAFLGYHWSGALPANAPQYAYVARKVKTDGWEHYAGLAIPPPGSKQVRVWLLNFKSAGNVAFDDIFFTSISLPQGGR